MRRFLSFLLCGLVATGVFASDVDLGLISDGTPTGTGTEFWYIFAQPTPPAAETNGIAVFVFNGTNELGLVEDQTTNGFDAVPNNVTFAGNGTNNWADLSGASGLLTIPTQPLMPTNPGTAWSVRGWFYPISQPQEIWGDDGLSQANKGHHISYSGANQFAAREARAGAGWGIEIDSAAVPITNWYMVTFIRRRAASSVAELWVNKTKSGTDNAAQQYNYIPAFPLQIGDSGQTNAGGRHFTGLVGYWEVVTNIYTGADITNFYDTEVGGY